MKEKLMNLLRSFYRKQWDFTFNWEPFGWKKDDMSDYYWNGETSNPIKVKFEVKNNLCQTECPHGFLNRGQLVGVGSRGCKTHFERYRGETINPGRDDGNYTGTVDCAKVAS